MKRQNKNKKKRSWKNRLINTLIVLMLLIGIGLIFNKEIRNSLIAMTIDKHQLSSVSKEQIEKNKKAKVSYDFSAIKPVDFSSVLGAQLNNQQLPVVGGIAIPDLKINLPIFLGINNTSLLFGAGTMKENQVMGQGNYALASHHVFGFYSNYSQLLFSPLQNAKNGMLIYITDKSKVYQYKIDSVTTVNPTDVSVIDDVPGKTLITLVTCEDLAATKRTIVQGTLEKTYDFNTAPNNIHQAFELKYNQIQ